MKINKFYKVKFIDDTVGIRVDSDIHKPKESFWLHVDDIIFLLETNIRMCEWMPYDIWGFKAFNITKNRIFYTKDLKFLNLIEI